MSGGQEKNFSTLGPKLRGNKAQQDYGDKQRQICIEIIDYRIKIFETRDREEDLEAKCRYYSSEAGQTYRDCVLASIKQNFEVS